MRFINRFKPNKNTLLFGFFRGFQLFAVVLCFAFSSCLPASYSIQVTEVVNCGTQAITGGTFDISVTDSYQMGVKISNWLTITANTSLYTPETNYVEIKKATVWFEYPKVFTLSSSDALYPNETTPREQSMYRRLEPSIQATIGGGAANPNVTTVNFNLVPTETANVWRTAKELTVQPPPTKTSTLGPHFIVVAHIKLYGNTGAGGELSTPELKFPIAVCKGCLTKSVNKSCITGGAAGCVGQDGACFDDVTAAP